MICTCIKFLLPGLVCIFVYKDSHLSLNSKQMSVIFQYETMICVFVIACINVILKAIPFVFILTVI